MPDAFIALGGNLGDVVAAFRTALAEMERRAGEVMSVSSAYRTKAMLPPGRPAAQPDYWNAVCRIRTQHTPNELMAVLKAIERESGRTERARWAPRPLDLDLLLYDERVIDEPDLRVPHAGLRERTFMLRPLVEIAPDVPVPPEMTTARRILLALGDPSAGIREIAPLAR